MGIWVIVSEGWYKVVSSANAKEEYYLTDVVTLARAEGCLLDRGPGFPLYQPTVPLTQM
jgi:bifunctional N-acetylglucosamine-1-phosphate-uridyltransferase/glucosamine-1-phosphate-acetyltransferase GlmU-like protein